MKRILVVGGGLIGMRHTQEVLDHPNCDLVGLVDPSTHISTPDSVVRFSQMEDVAEPVDGAIIATPTQLHAQHGAYAAARGWHILVEKPVAQDQSDAKALRDAVRQHGIGSLVGHHRRYHAPVKQLRNLLSQGEIGQIVNVSLIWAMRKPDAYFENNWRTADGSPVMINLVHDLDVLRFVVGEIDQVAALRGGSVRQTDRLESGAIAMTFANGATGTISFADTSPSPWGFEAGTGENPNIGTTGEDMLWITGTRGAISFPSMTLWRGESWSTAAQKSPMPVLQNTHTPLRAQLDHFLEVIDGATPLIDINDASRTLDIALDIERQMSRQGQERAARTAPQ